MVFDNQFQKKCLSQILKRCLWIRLRIFYVHNIHNALPRSLPFSSTHLSTHRYADDFFHFSTSSRYHLPSYTYVNSVYVIMLCHNFSSIVWHFLKAVLFNRVVDYEHLSAITYSFSIWWAWPFEMIFSMITTPTTIGKTNAPFFFVSNERFNVLNRTFLGREKNIYRNKLFVIYFENSV